MRNELGGGNTSRKERQPHRDYQPAECVNTRALLCERKAREVKKKRQGFFFNPLNQKRTNLPLKSPALRTFPTWRQRVEQQLQGRNPDIYTKMYLPTGNVTERKKRRNNIIRYLFLFDVMISGGKAGGNGLRIMSMYACA